MGQTWLDKCLWLAVLAGQVSLLAAMVGRKRLRRFPFFAAFIAYTIAEALIATVVYELGSRNAYFWTFSALAVPDALLQVAIVYEMAREVLQPAGAWVGTRRAWIFLAGSVALAAALSFAVDPRVSGGIYDALLRFSLFTTLLIAELVTLLFLFASRLGLQWRNWVMGLAQGFAIWVVVSLATETAANYWGWFRQFSLLDHLRILSYLAALGIWTVTFWRDEPERRPLSPEMRKYLVTIADTLEYDLRRLRSGR